MKYLLLSIFTAELDLLEASSVLVELFADEVLIQIYICSSEKMSPHVYRHHLRIFTVIDYLFLRLPGLGLVGACVLGHVFKLKFDDRGGVYSAIGDPYSFAYSSLLRDYCLWQVSRGQFRSLDTRGRSADDKLNKSKRLSVALIIPTIRRRRRRRRMKEGRK